jgi:hypothetical protein
MHLAKGPVGLSDLAAQGLPSGAEVQALVRSDQANYEVVFAELTSCVLKSKHWLGGTGALTLQSTKRGKLFFRFLDPAQHERAQAALHTALRTRLTVE